MVYYKQLIPLVFDQTNKIKNIWDMTLQGYKNDITYLINKCLFSYQFWIIIQFKWD